MEASSILLMMLADNIYDGCSSLLCTFLDAVLALLLLISSSVPVLCHIACVAFFDLMDYSLYLSGCLPPGILVLQWHRLSSVVAQQVVPTCS